RVNTYHAGVLWLGQDGIALHITVVLVGDPGLIGQVRGRHHGQPLVAQLAVAGRSREAAGAVGPERVLPGGSGVRAFVLRPVMGHRTRRDVGDTRAVPVDLQVF